MIHDHATKESPETFSKVTQYNTLGDDSQRGKTEVFFCTTNRVCRYISRSIGEHSTQACSASGAAGSREKDAGQEGGKRTYVHLVAQVARA